MATNIFSKIAQWETLTRAYFVIAIIGLGYFFRLAYLNHVKLLLILAFASVNQLLQVHILIWEMFKCITEGWCCSDTSKNGRIDAGKSILTVVLLQAFVLWRRPDSYQFLHQISIGHLQYLEANDSLAAQGVIYIVLVRLSITSSIVLIGILDIT